MDLNEIYRRAITAGNLLEQCSAALLGRGDVFPDDGNHEYQRGTLAARLDSICLTLNIVQSHLEQLGARMLSETTEHTAPATSVVAASSSDSEDRGSDP